jgi:hypothetical protein
MQAGGNRICLWLELSYDRPEGHPGFVSYRRLSPQFQFSLPAVTLGILSRWYERYTGPGQWFREPFCPQCLCTRTGSERLESDTFGLCGRISVLLALGPWIPLFARTDCSEILCPLESPVWREVEWTLKKLFCVIKDLEVISRAQSDLTFSTICRKISRASEYRVQC